MSISLSAYASATYIGTPYSQPMQIAGTAARCVPLTFNWAAYGVGDDLTEIAVSVNLQTAQNSPAPLLDVIRSIYIDNTGNNYALYVQFPDTGFTVAAQSYSTGWYPVFTNAFNLIVAGLQFNDENQLSSANVFITNVNVSPYSDVAYQLVLPQKLSSPSIGGGNSPITDVSILLGGASYPNADLTVTGGGGSGATLQGTINQWGTFTNVEITDGGSGYTGVPIVTPSAQSPPAGYVQGDTYAINAYVTYDSYIWQFVGPVAINTGAPAWNGNTTYYVGNQVSGPVFIYECIVGDIKGSLTEPSGTTSSNSYWKFVGSIVPSNSAGYNWTQGPPSAATVSFLVEVGQAANPIITGAFGYSALGDQFSSFCLNISNIGSAIGNLFGSPYANGFIYITAISISCIEESSASGVAFQLESASGEIVGGTIKAYGVAQLVTISNCNLKLDATQTWGINVTGASGNVEVQFAFTFTWANQ